MGDNHEHGTDDSCPNGGTCDGTGCSTKRRAVLGTLAGGSLTALAGCVGVFGEPTPRDQPQFGVPDVYDIDLISEEATISTAGDEYILESAEAAGFELPYFCRTGYCGACIGKVDGDGHELVHMTINQVNGLDDAAISEGYFLTCTGQPRDHFSMETGVRSAFQQYLVEREYYDVDYVNEEDTIEVRGDESLLVAGEEQGWDLPYACRSGFCGQCLAKVDGDGHELVEMTNNQVEGLTDEAIADGYVLTCTGKPRDSFALETGKAGALDEYIDEEPQVHTIDYVNERWTIEVPEDQSLLVAGEERGFDLPYACRSGFCGQCLAKVDGDGHELVEMTNNQVEGLTDEAIEEGYVLTCTGKPRDDFALETGKAGELDD